MYNGQSSGVFQEKTGDYAIGLYRFFVDSLAGIEVFVNPTWEELVMLKEQGLTRKIWYM